MTQRHQKSLEAPDLFVRPCGDFAGESFERHAEEITGHPEAGNLELITAASSDVQDRARWLGLSFRASYPHLLIQFTYGFGEFLFTTHDQIHSFLADVVFDCRTREVSGISRLKLAAEPIYP